MRVLLYWVRRLLFKVLRLYAKLIRAFYMGVSWYILFLLVLLSNQFAIAPAFLYGGVRVPYSSL